MKKAVILHGTDGSPEGNWLPWLKRQLESKGYEVWVPLLPNNHTPNRQVYNDFLFDSGWDFHDNLVIGHSSGAVSVLNLLEDERCPHIKAGVMVGAWHDTKNSPLKDTYRFDNLFPLNGFNFQRIKSQADRLIYIHGDDDNHCPVEQAKWLAKQTDSEIIIIPGGRHLTGSAGFTELPQLTAALQDLEFQSDLKEGEK